MSLHAFQPRAESDNFDRFWQAYPVKRGKLDALKAWHQVHPDEATLEQILEAIAEQKRCRQWRDGFIPYPATWLRRGSWMDELGPQDFYQAKL